LRILVISNLYPPHFLGGYEILCHQVNQVFQARGHEVVALTSDFRNMSIPDGDTGVHEGIPVHRDLETYLPFNAPASPAKLVRMRVARANQHTAGRLIRAVQPDIIFVWSQLRVTVGAALAAEASGIPVVYTMNDDHLAGYGFGHFGLRPATLAHCIADRLLFRGITYGALRLENVTCISECVKKDLVDQNIPIQDARVIYQGIPIERFPLATAADRYPAGIENALENRPLRILYVGQLHPYKGVHTLVEAAVRVAERRGRRALEVTIVGGGAEEYVGELRRAASRGCAAVAFAGKQPHHRMAALYRDHDVFVFPSIWREPFGLTHLEAMASGTPVVSTADGGHGEFLVDGENALVFTKDDAGSLAAALEKILDDPGLALRLAGAARTMVETRFTLDRYVSDLESYLQELVNRCVTELVTP